jgi:hypothetical protein
VPSEQELLENVKQAAEQLAYAVSQTESCYEKRNREIEVEFNRQVAATRAASETRLAAARASHAKTLEQVRAELRMIQQGAGIWAAGWEDQLWGTYMQAAAPPAVVRLGTLRVNSPYGSVDSPALLPFTGGGNLIIKCSGAAKSTAAEALQSLALRLLATCPPAKLRLLLIDPVGLGQNVAAFMHLADYSKDLITGQAWTEPSDVQKRLAELSAHMEMVIQKYLRNRYQNMEDYNQKAGEVEEPYRLLAAVNFPTGFTDEAAGRLVSIASNGPRCGVYTYVTVDMDQMKNRRFNLADLERTAAVIEWDGRRFVWQDADFREAQLELESPPTPAHFEALVHAVGAASKDAVNRVILPFSKVALPSDRWWSAKSSSNLSVPIGKAGAEGTQNFSVDQETAVHTLVAGIPGSGKSTLMHVLIMSLAVAYPPEELELYLVDFKKGVEFQAYAPQDSGRGALPHARVIAIESEREFGFSVLQALDKELTKRGDKFRGVASNLADYRQKTNEKVPRILLIVDEFHEFFSQEDTIAQQSSLLIDRLVKQGRSFGIHLLLATQTLTGTHGLSRSTMDLMAIRIALRCGEEDSRFIVGDNSAYALLTRRGEAIYNASVGRKEGNTRFQVAWLEDKGAIIEQLCKKGAELPIPPEAPALFEGNKPAQVESNRPLDQIIHAAEWPKRERVVPAWVGSPVAIKGPTNARIFRQAGRNLAVIGRDEEAAAGVLMGALVSLAAHYRPDEAQFYLLNALTAEMEWAERAEYISDVFPHDIEQVPRRKMADAIAKLAGVVDQRVKEDATRSAPIFLVGLGMHRVRDLQLGDAFAARQANVPPSPAMCLAKVLKDGPEYGVHVMGWWDGFASLARSVDRKSLPDIGIRVALPMAGEDSTHLLDSPAAAKLVAHRALLWDEEHVGSLEKFVPYSPPRKQWLEDVGSLLRQKARRANGPTH